jgi:hypothetical protein
MNSLTAVSDVTQRSAHILARSGRSDGKQRFRAAVRHSRHVRILRIAVPLSVAVVVVGGIALTVLKPLRVLSGVPVDVGSLVVSGTKIMMQQPRLAGFTRDNRRYNMIAQAAAQDVTKPDMIELHGINATMEMKDGAVFETTAKDGTADAEPEYRGDVFERLQSPSERGGDRRSSRQGCLGQTGGGEDGDVDHQCQRNGGCRLRRCHAVRPWRIRYHDA